MQHRLTDEQKERCQEKIARFLLRSSRFEKTDHDIHYPTDSLIRFLDMISRKRVGPDRINRVMDSLAQLATEINDICSNQETDHAE